MGLKGSTGLSDQRTDMTTKVAGMAAAFAAAFVARKIITFAWTKLTGKVPPVSPEDPEVGIKEALGWAVVTGVGLEAARLLATRATAKRVRAYQAGQAEK